MSQVLKLTEQYMDDLMYIFRNVPADRMSETLEEMNAAMNMLSKMGGAFKLGKEILSGEKAPEAAMEYVKVLQEEIEPDSVFGPNGEQIFIHEYEASGKKQVLVGPDSLMQKFVNIIRLGHAVGLSETMTVTGKRPLTPKSLLTVVGKTKEVGGVRGRDLVNAVMSIGEEEFVQIRYDGEM